MQKLLVFVSHIKPERIIADSFRKLIESKFMGLIEVFVSSDPESIAMGGRWLEEITQGLKTCIVEVVLASPLSVRRPWINFEAGAGWVRDIPVIPVCHSGMTPDFPPPPLSSLQAALATDQEQMERVLAVLANKLGCNRPQDEDCSDFIECVKQFEAESQQLSSARSDALLAESEGLAPHATATLIAAAECSQAPGDHVWPSHVINRMKEAGYREIAATLGMAILRRKGLIDTAKGPDWNENMTVVIVNQRGWEWLESNVDKVQLEMASRSELFSDPEDIPF